MKWECLAVVLETPLKEEWVSIFRILSEIPLITALSLIRCNARFSLSSVYVTFPFVNFFCFAFLFTCFYRKLPRYGPYEFWNGPPGRRQHGSHGRDGPDGHGQDGPCA